MPKWDAGQVRAATCLCSRRKGQVWLEEAVLQGCNGGQGLQTQRNGGLREACLSLKG